MGKKYTADDAVAAATKTVDGYKTERALLPNGRTMERVTHPESGTVGDWVRIRSPFYSPEDWIRWRESTGWTVTLTPESKARIKTKSNIALAVAAILILVVCWPLIKFILYAIFALVLGLLFALLGRFTTPRRYRGYLGW